MMAAETVSETLVYVILTRLIAREDFIAKSVLNHKVKVLFMLKHHAMKVSEGVEVDINDFLSSTVILCTKNCC
jgi:hypothetical protein